MCTAMFVILKRLNALRINMSLKLFMMQRIRLAKHTKERELALLVMHLVLASMQRRSLIVLKAGQFALGINSLGRSFMN